MVPHKQLKKGAELEFTEAERKSPTKRRIRILQRQAINRIPPLVKLTVAPSERSQHTSHLSLFTSHAPVQEPSEVEQPTFNANVADPDDLYQDSVKREQAIQAFLFLSREIGWAEFRFEPDVVEEVYSEMADEVRELYADMDRMSI